LQSEIAEIRGVLNSKDEFQKMEDTLSHLSGILVNAQNKQCGLSEAQFRQLCTIFNYKEQTERLYSQLNQEFEESSKLVNIHANFKHPVER